MSGNILILGGGLQALSVAYSLWRTGNPALCMADKSEEIKHSRFIRKFYPKQGKDVTEQLLELVRSEHIGLVIPMSDQMAECLSRNKTLLANTYQCFVPVPQYDTFIVGTDKAKLMLFCEKYGFPHPRTRALEADTLTDAAAYVQFPALIKPNRSVGARGITLVHSPEELQQQLPVIEKKYGSATLQEYVETENTPYYNVMLYRTATGQITGHAIIEILRYYPVKGGSSSLCRTIEDDSLLTTCIKVLEQLQWQGMADFDVLKTKQGEYKIIEINPRVPASLRAADIAGVNFPELMVQESLHKPLSVPTYRKGLYLRYFGLDIMWFLQSHERWTAKPNWFFSIGRNFYFQDIYAKDPSTWCSWLVNGFKRFLEKRKHIQA